MWARVWILRSASVQSVPEVGGSLIKQELDRLITLALECVGESQRDGRGS